MSAIGGVIDSAVDAAFGKSSGTTLQDFLSQFSSSEGIWAKTIDPFATFDVTMRFYPSKWSESSGSGDWKDKLADSLLTSAKSATKNLANNMTGGLVGSIMNNLKGKGVMDMHNAAKDYDKYTFMEYLVPANKIVGKNDWIGESAGESIHPLELQLGPYCQEITLPNIEIPSNRTSQTSIGEFPVNGMIVKPDTNVITMKIVNTKVPLHERIFYPWMREVVSPSWQYNTQPYTTATITVDFSKHSDLKYVFCGCRPQKIIMQQATQDSTSPNLVRDVSFLFDCMLVKSNRDTSESLEDKLLSTGKSLVKSAGSLVGI